LSAPSLVQPRRAALARLLRRLRALDSLAVAYSGGVDSCVLLHAAHRALGARAAAIIADSPSLPRRELCEALAAARAFGARVVVVATDELADPGYRANAGLRCYHCKDALFRAMEAWARAHGFAALAFGEITDDLADDRPGRRAAVERGVLAPLRDAGLGKADVRAYARAHGLAAAEKPASACLASRLPLGTAVTRERLARVERAEEAVRALGFRVLRVRDHGARARLEVGETELARAQALRGELDAVLEREGFAELELAVYRPPGAALAGSARATNPSARARS
jgi:uncharacterized protein